jgi:hypothetical protein
MVLPSIRTPEATGPTREFLPPPVLRAKNLDLEQQCRRKKRPAELNLQLAAFIEIRAKKRSEDTSGSHLIGNQRMGLWDVLASLFQPDFRSSVLLLSADNCAIEDRTAVSDHGVGDRAIQKNCALNRPR